MNRQQAPQPVVRPLREFNQFGDVGEMLLQQPVESSGDRCLLVAIPDESGLEYVLLLRLVEGNGLAGELCYCELEGDDKAKFVSANGVSEVTNIMSLPCHEKAELIDDIANVCRNFINKVIEAMKWNADDFIAEERADIATRMLECRYNG